MQVLAEKTLFKNHTSSIGYWVIRAVGAPRPGIQIHHSKTLTGEGVQHFAATKAKNVGRKNETTPEQQALLELEAKWLLQLKKGYVETVEAANDPVTNTLGKKKPMLAVDFDQINEDDIDWENAFIQPKFDGNRGLRDGFMYSRAGNEFVNLDHLNSPIAGTPLASLHLDGEIYTHGVPLQKITGYIKKLQPGTQELMYWLYDVVDDAPFAERYAMLEAAFKASPPHPLIKLAPTLRVRNLGELRAAHKMFTEQKFEGSILRLGIDGYEDDKRSRNLIKVKDFQDTEFKVIGCTFGKPNKGPNGEELLNPVFHYQIKPGLVAKVSAPGTHLEKHEQGVHFEFYIDKYLTIEHMGYTPKGIPNIATAKCWREDL